MRGRQVYTVVSLAEIHGFVITSRVTGGNAGQFSDEVIAGLLLSYGRCAA